MCLTAFQYFILRKHPGNNLLILAIAIEGLSNFTEMALIFQNKVFLATMQTHKKVKGIFQTFRIL